MKTLSIDIETYSDIPLQKTGVYRYVESPDFEILLFAFAFPIPEQHRHPPMRAEAPLWRTKS